MELRFSPLFSGSSGNAIYVACDDAQILVDAGYKLTGVIKTTKFGTTKKYDIPEKSV